ncbi:YceI family protein [Streptomyces sp. NPDC021080]|uniref:YceI family protein n=1 Tax=Streptomyces sp. NPDC021080 TaxID=3365110 RepID=UPI0037A611A0
MTAPTPELTGDYTFDPYSTQIGFAVRHVMLTKLHGSFHELEGTLHLDAADPAKSTGQVVLKAESIDTSHEQRDQQLRTNDFLDVPNFPDITFRTTEVEAKSDTDYRVTGDLTIKATTKSVTIDFQYTGNAVDPYGNQRIGLDGSVTISLKDFDINQNPTLKDGGALVGDRAVLKFAISAIKQG